MQNNYEMIRMCILTFGLAGLSWEDMRKQQLHGWAILLLGISGMTISLLGGCWKIRYGFGIIAGDIYAYTGLEYKGKYWIWGWSGNLMHGMFLCIG